MDASNEVLTRLKRLMHKRKTKPNVGIGFDQVMEEANDIYSREDGSWG